MPDNDILKFFDEICLAGNIDIVKRGKVYYRARRIKPENIRHHDDYQSKFYGFNKEECLAPPSNQAKAGRANPKNIAYLYFAEDEYTALAEVRPSRKDYISIAEIVTNSDLKLFSFRFVEKNISSENYLKRIMSWLSYSFALPVDNEDEIEYLPTQYLAEYIKNRGFDGIKYDSSLAEDGINVALFDQTKAEAISSKVYQVQSVLYMAARETPGEGRKELTPKI
jgi:hypothetical protein